jgi:hypothetical protein
MQRTVPSPVQYFRLLFAYTSAVWNLPTSRLCDYAVRCKACGETIPAPVETMPGSWIAAECPLCGAKRRYLPPDIFRGRLSHKIALGRKIVRSEMGFRE